MNPPPTDPDELLRPKRNWSVWSLLAPASLIVVVILMIAAISGGGESDEINASPSKDASKGSSTTADKKPVRVQNAYRVKAGDSIGAISARFDMTESQLKTCNPRTLTDNYTIQPGMRLNVNKEYCKKREKAAQAKIDKLMGTGGGSGSTTGTGTNSAEDSSDQ